VVRALRRHPEAWVDFMMRFELGLERPDPRRALRSAVTIGASYVAGGFIPLASYMVFHDVRMALGVSVTVTLLALLGFGYVKGRFTGTRPLRSALQTTLIGGLAAGAAFAIARAIS
jgi:VIT1/CCC1 family predicted Fe2+/Mn2+ transporter